MRIISKSNCIDIFGKGGSDGGWGTGFSFSAAGEAYNNCSQEVAKANPETNSADASLMGNAICVGVGVVAGLGGGGWHSDGGNGANMGGGHTGDNSSPQGHYSADRSGGDGSGGGGD